VDKITALAVVAALFPNWSAYPSRTENAFLYMVELAYGRSSHLLLRPDCIAILIHTILQSSKIVLKLSAYFVQNCILEKYVGPQSPVFGELYSHRN
jgi:hypothetical protein